MSTLLHKIRAAIGRELGKAEIADLDGSRLKMTALYEAHPHGQGIPIAVWRREVRIALGMAALSDRSIDPRCYACRDIAEIVCDQVIQPAAGSRGSICNRACCLKHARLVGEDRHKCAACAAPVAAPWGK